MAVTDSEILSHFVDICMLVVTANKTEVDWMLESVDLLKQNKDVFLGVVLNKFNYKSGYRSYYKYYQYYSTQTKNKSKLGITKRRR